MQNKEFLKFPITGIIWVIIGFLLAYMRDILWIGIIWIIAFLFFYITAHFIKKPEPLNNFLSICGGLTLVIGLILLAVLCS